MREVSLSLLPLVIVLALVSGVLAWRWLTERRRSRAAQAAARQARAELQAHVSARQAVQSNFERLRLHMLDAYAAVDTQGLIQEANPAYQELTGYSLAELRQLTYDQLTPSPWHEQERQIIQEQVKVRGYSEVYEKEYRHKDGRVVPVELRTFLIGDVADVPAGMWAMVRSIANRKQAEAQLRASEARYRAVVTAAPVVSFCLDTEGKFTLSEGSGLSRLGLLPGQVVGQSVFDIYQDIPDALEHFRRALTGEPRQGLVTTHGLIYQCWWTPLFDEHRRVVQVLGVAVDITDLKQAEQQTRASLEEKVVLLKEVHHRVKNNLQVISSLLSLQADQADNDRAQEVLRETQNRVRSLGLIHETLYRSENLAQVDFSDYIRRLCEYLRRAFETDADRVEMTVDVGSVALNLDEAVPCGLVINELVSNALKYAFPDGRKGRVGVEFRLTPEGRRWLAVWDDGVGLAEGYDLQNAESLGLRLVHNLAAQLEGDLRVRHEGGTRWELVFGQLASKRSLE